MLSTKAFTPPTGATLDHKTSTSLRPSAHPSRRPWRMPPPPPPPQPPPPQMAAGRWIRRGRRQGTCPCTRHAKVPRTTLANLRWLGQRKDQSSEPRSRLDLPRMRSNLERRQARAASARPKWRRPERATRRSRRPPHLQSDAIRRSEAIRRDQRPSECSPRQRQTPGSPTVIVNVEPYASSPELASISRSIPYAA